MSSGPLALGDLVCPCLLVGVHGSVDDVDKVSLEDAASTPGALDGLVTGQQLLGGRVPSFLHDGGGVEDAIEPAIASSVQPVEPSTRNGVSLGQGSRPL